MTIRRRAATAAALLLLTAAGVLLAAGPARAQLDVPPEQMPLTGHLANQKPEVTMRACDPYSGITDLIDNPATIIDRQTGATVPATRIDRYGACGYTLHHRLAWDEWSLKAGHLWSQTLSGIRTFIAVGQVRLIRLFFGVDISETLRPSTIAATAVVSDEFFPRLSVIGLAALGVFLLLVGLINRGEFSPARGVSAIMFALVLAAPIGYTFNTQPERIITAYSDTMTNIRRWGVGLAAYAGGYSGSISGAGDTQVHAIEESFWDLFGHRPWLVEQFGSQSGGSEYAVDILSAASLTQQEAAIVRAGGPEAVEVLEAKDAAFTRVVEEMEEERPDVYSVFRGEKPTQQQQVALLGIIAAALGGAVPVLLVGATVVLQALADAAWVGAPIIVGILGLFPGWGQVVAKRYLYMMAGLTLTILLLSMMAGLLLLFVQAIIANADAVASGWIGAVATTIALLLGTFVFRRRIFSLFTTTYAAPGQYDPISKMSERTSRVVQRFAAAGAGSFFGNRFGNRSRGGNAEEVDQADPADPEGEEAAEETAGAAESLDGATWVDQPGTRTGPSLDDIDVDAPLDAEVARATPTGLDDDLNDYYQSGRAAADDEALAAEHQEADTAGIVGRPPAAVAAGGLDAPLPFERRGATKRTPAFAGAVPPDYEPDPRPLNQRYQALDRKDLGLDEPPAAPARPAEPRPSGDTLGPGSSIRTAFDRADHDPATRPAPRSAPLDYSRTPPSEPEGMPGWPEAEALSRDPDPQVRLDGALARQRLTEQYLEWRTAYDAAALGDSGEGEGDDGGGEDDGEHL